MTEIKLELVVRPARQGDFVPKEEEVSEEAARLFLDSGVGQEQLTQIVDCSKRLTIVSKAVCEVYVGKTRPVNSDPS